MQTLPRSRWSRPKIIQIELNHILPPPIAYRDMCGRDAHTGSDAPGRSGIPYDASLDVWGCSMQAAYDLVRPHGFRLLQYDWPDGVFIHEDYVDAFPRIPWLVPENFAAAYWNGRIWADEMYSRMQAHVTDRAWVVAMMNSANSAFLHPRQWLQGHIIRRWNATWRKRPLWIEMGITGTGVSVRVECNAVSKKADALQLYSGYVPSLAAGAHDDCTMHGLRYTWNTVPVEQ